jgi:hypothetical protein
MGSSRARADENANELAIIHGSSVGVRFFHATSSQDMPFHTPYTDTGNWHHVAFVWTADPTHSHNGQLAYYLDGEMTSNVTECAVGACDMGMAINVGGVLHLGQEADRPYGDFEELQGFTGVVDELRVWTSVRTDAEIRASYEVGLSSYAVSDLSFAWGFDEPSLVRDSTTLDLSGHGNNGLVGRMPTVENQLQ